MSRELRCVKPEIRIVGVDDGYFEPHTKGMCEVIGVVFRGGHWLDGVMRTQVEIDGMDATEKVASMIMNSSHYGQLRVILLDGITLAGFNVIDTSTLFATTRLPVIVVTRDEPDFESIRRALQNLPNMKQRWKAIEAARKIVKVFTRGSQSVFMQVTGLQVSVAEKIVKKSATRSSIPEPLRVAHLIASGTTAPKNRS